MKPFTLSFYSQDLENEYKKSRILQDVKLLRQTMLIEAFFGVLTLIMSIVIKETMVSILCTLNTLSCFLLYQCVGRYPWILEPSLFFFQVLFPSSNYFVYLAGINAEVLRDYDTYLTGQTTMLMCSSFMFAGRFSLKAVAVFINGTVQFYMKIILKRDPTILAIAWMGSIYIYLKYLYEEEKMRRTNFMLKSNEQSWQLMLVQNDNIAILKCNQEQGKIMMKMFNRGAEAILNVKDQETFKSFLRNTMIKSSNTGFNFKQALTNKFLTLESLIFSQLSDFSSTNTEKLGEATGFLNRQLYNIRIFTTWENNIINSNISVQKSIQTPDKNSDIFGPLFTTYRDLVLQEIGRLRCSTNRSILNRSNARRLFCIQAMTYSLSIFLKKYPMPQIQCINLRKLVDEIFQLHPSQLKDRNLQNLISPDLYINSCGKSLMIILHNIIQTVFYRKQSRGFLSVQVHEKINKSSLILTNIIQIQILTNCVTEEFKEIFLNQGSKLNKPQHVNVQGVATWFLISQIGPDNRLLIIDRFLGGQMIIFQIFKNLDVLKMVSGHMKLCRNRRDNQDLLISQ